MCPVAPSQVARGRHVVELVAKPAVLGEAGEMQRDGGERERDGNRVGSGPCTFNHRGAARWSLAGRRLPKFYLVSFWIDDPAKLPVLGIVDLLENIAAFFAQDFDQGVEILHPLVDHESCSAGRKLVTLRRTNRPEGCSGYRLPCTFVPG